MVSNLICQLLTTSYTCCINSNRSLRNTGTVIATKCAGPCESCPTDRGRESGDPRAATPTTVTGSAATREPRTASPPRREQQTVAPPPTQQPGVTMEDVLAGLSSIIYNHTPAITAAKPYVDGILRHFVVHISNYTDMEVACPRATKYAHRASLRSWIDRASQGCDEDDTAVDAITTAQGVTRSVPKPSS